MSKPLRSVKAEPAAPFTLPELPWAKGALEPVISSRTIELHHGKHHRTYVEKLNKLVAGTEFERMPLHEVVRRTHDDPSRVEIFNNAGQALNHDFYWQSLSPRAMKPSEDLRRLLDRDLGGYDAFVTEFTREAIAHFGSGWVWLVAKGGALEIVKTGNAEVPFTNGMRRCSPSTSGSTRTTSTTRTGAKSTSPRWSRSC